MASLSGTLVTPQGLVTGTLHFGERLEALEPGRATGLYVLPGFIDTHVHGGGGGDTMDGAEGVRRLAAFHVGHGTTTLYPTTITSPWESVVNALRGVKTVMGEGKPNLPAIPGVHLEGPFISPKRLGAQPPHAQAPTPEKVDELLGLEVVKLVTLAPELPQALAAAKSFAAKGVRVSVGHTQASYEETRSFVKSLRAAGGVVGFTHLYNAMGGLQGRAPGPVGAALADEESYAELIFDTHHVHAGSFLSALNAKPDHLHLVTDAIRACGEGEGETELGGQTVRVEGGAARLPDGTLAGSVLTLDQALRNILAVGVSLEQASRLLSATPARYMGLGDRGTLEIGKRADLVMLDENFEVLEVYVAGRKVYG